MGDEIREINGISVANQTVEQLQKMLVSRRKFLFLRPRLAFSLLAFLLTHKQGAVFCDPSLAGTITGVHLNFHNIPEN